MMKSRRSLLTSLIVAAFALMVTVGSALAAELMGTIQSVDVDAKKMVVKEKDTDKEVTVSVSDDTDWITPKKTIKGKDYDLAKVKKGTTVEITHEDAKASKVVIKKGAGKKKDAN